MGTPWLQHGIHMVRSRQMLSLVMETFEPVTITFEASRLDAQLNAAATLFFSEERNVDLRPVSKTVRFNEILRFYTRDFLAVSPSLIAYANKYRTEKIPLEWKVEFIPYDWTVNRQ